MAPEILFIFFILALIVANGVFAMAEIAVVSARKARLQRRAEQGDARARVALELANAPDQFLSTVQVGITLVGVLAGAFGGASLAGPLGEWLNGFERIAPHGPKLAIGIVVALITYLSLIIGELVPKRVALNDPERIASLVAKPMRWLSTIASPFVWFLSWSSSLVLRAFGLKPSGEPPVSEDEVKVMIEQGLGAGVFHKGEQAMVEGVFALDEQTAADLMTPRSHLIWLNVDDPEEVTWRKVVGCGHSQFPVYQGNRDHVLGLVTVKALFANLAFTGRAELRSLIEPPLIVPEKMTATRLLEEYRKSRRHVALVVDEFGGTRGLVALHDVVEAIVGQLPEREQRYRPTALRRDDGSWLIDAALEFNEVKRALGVRHLPGEEGDDFVSLGGFLIHHSGHLPREGEKITVGEWLFEIVDTDRVRLDKVLVRHLGKAPESGRPAP